MSPAATRAAQAAFMALGCIERIHDLSSLETAGQAVQNYTMTLAQTSPEAQEEAKKAHPDVPSLREVLQSYKEAAAALNVLCFAPDLAQVS